MNYPQRLAIALPRNDIEPVDREVEALEPGPTETSARGRVVIAMMQQEIARTL